MLNSQNTHLIETSYDRLKSKGEITFQQYRENLAKRRFSDGLQISMNIKDITIPLIIHYYLRGPSEHYTNTPLNHNIGFLPVSAPGRWHNTIRVRVNPVPSF